jgi:hypothetical protein
VAQLRTHVSAIAKTSSALSHEGRGLGGNIDPGRKGVSVGHSNSVSASARVPFSQLRATPLRSAERLWGHPIEESTAHLWLDMLTALACTRRMTVVVSARGTGEGETRAGKREITSAIYQDIYGGLWDCLPSHRGASMYHAKRPSRGRGTCARGVEEWQIGR